MIYDAADLENTTTCNPICRMVS